MQDNTERLRRRHHMIRGISFCMAVLIVFFNGGLAAEAQGRPPDGGAPASSPALDPIVLATRRWDANHDGVFTCDEWKQYADRLFSRGDTNANGFLEANELKQLAKVEPILSDADITYFDADNDKRLSRKEFLDKPNPLFARFDANSDCRVTAQEIELQGKPARAERRPPAGRGGPGGPGLGINF